MFVIFDVAAAKRHRALPPVTRAQAGRDNRPMLRLFVDHALSPDLAIGLPPGPARHVQVRRLQPGDTVLLFNGLGGEWQARITHMGRHDVQVQVERHDLVDRERRVAVTLAVGMPANERMDWLVEKACELGAAAVQPLVCERSVLRLDGERAARKREHWQAQAVAAAEQCGRTRVMQVLAVQRLPDWLAGLGPRQGLADAAARWLLSPGAPPVQRSTSLADAAGGAGGLVVLSGPEGGLSPAEEAAARAAGFVPVGLGPRVLRAETAPLAVLAGLGHD